MQPNQKMIQQLQAKLMKIQEDLGNETVEASVGGVVTVVMTGHHEVRSVKIDPEAVDPSDGEMREEQRQRDQRQRRRPAGEDAPQKDEALLRRDEQRRSRPLPQSKSLIRTINRFRAPLTARNAARLLTLMLVLFGLVVWVPLLLSAPRNSGNWSEFAETFAIAGATWILADLLGE